MSDRLNGENDRPSTSYADSSMEWLVETARTIEPPTLRHAGEVFPNIAQNLDTTLDSIKSQAKKLDEDGIFEGAAAESFQNYVGELLRISGRVVNALSPSHFDQHPIRGEDGGGGNSGGYGIFVDVGDRAQEARDTILDEVEAAQGFYKSAAQLISAGVGVMFFSPATAMMLFGLGKVAAEMGKERLKKAREAMQHLSDEVYLPVGDSLKDSLGKALDTPVSSAGAVFQPPPVETVGNPPGVPGNGQGMPGEQLPDQIPQENIPGVPAEEGFGGEIPSEAGQLAPGEAVPGLDTEGLATTPGELGEEALGENGEGIGGGAPGVGGGGAGDPAGGETPGGLDVGGAGEEAQQAVEDAKAAGQDAIDGLNEIGNSAPSLDSAGEGAGGGSPGGSPGGLDIGEGIGGEEGVGGGGEGAGGGGDSAAGEAARQAVEDAKAAGQEAIDGLNEIGGGGLDGIGGDAPGEGGGGAPIGGGVPGFGGGGSEGTGGGGDSAGGGDNGAGEAARQAVEDAKRAGQEAID
ncbi:hypothetical protein, partial [Actinoalloteichus caeruleus]|uniref:WXG100 family type VII secretion target n=2 Tax=Actinoalloteichus cyanogriseus TaxID=2893586 RepID=UPI0004AA7D36